jgi:hypothetical protein
MSRRKMTADDLAIFRRVVKDHGARKVGRYLAVVYRACPWSIFRIRTALQRDAFCFLVLIARDYTFRAVYDAFEQITPRYHAWLNRQAA